MLMYFSPGIYHTINMTRLFLALIGLFWMNLAFGQREINSAKTEQHQQVKGTRFFLVPPAGFSDAAGFQGFQESNSGATLMVIEIPGPFAESTKGFTEEAFKAQGVTLKKREDIRFNGREGLFITAEQSAYGIDFAKYILIFGDSKTTCMVNGTYPKASPELDQDISASMLSTVYDTTAVVDPLASIGFSINTEGTKLRFGKNMSGMLIYTTDGQVPTQSEDKAGFVVGMSLANVQIPDKKVASVNRLKKMPYNDLNIDESQVKPVETDGISGYEIVAEGVSKSTGVKELVYQVMLYTDKGYYIMVGTAKGQFEANLELFKKVAGTFRRK